MKVMLPFKLCLLACSVLAGAPAFADPIFTTQSIGTVNSIEFSFMEFTGGPTPPVQEEQNDAPPELPPLQPDQQDVPLPSGGPGASLPVGAPPAGRDADEPDPRAADVPEPGTLALLGLGLAGLALRRRA